jgi:hypothetical protein
MAVLHSYIISVAVRNGRLVYYTPHTGYVHGTYGTMPLPGYYMTQPQVVPAYPPGANMPNSTPHFSQYPGAWVG